MNREKIKELLPILKAYSRGEIIQHKENDKWVDGDEYAFHDKPENYRIKPERLNMWIARDSGNKLFLYEDKPIKNAKNEVWRVSKEDTDCYSMDYRLFPEVNWEDDEPAEVEIIMKKIYNDR